MFGWRMFHPIVLMFTKQTCLFLNKNHSLVFQKKNQKIKPKEMLELNNKESKKMKVRTIKIGGSI